jgi:hypothetical protein
MGRKYPNQDQGPDGNGRTSVNQPDWIDRLFLQCTTAPEGKESLSILSGYPCEPGDQLKPLSSDS